MFMQPLYSSDSLCSGKNLALLIQEMNGMERGEQRELGRQSKQ
jgi:hypothetical protein